MLRITEYTDIGVKSARCSLHWQRTVLLHKPCFLRFTLILPTLVHSLLNDLQGTQFSVWKLLISEFSENSPDINLRNPAQKYKSADQLHFSSLHLCHPVSSFRIKKAEAKEAWVISSRNFKKPFMDYSKRHEGAGPKCPGTCADLRHKIACAWLLSEQRIQNILYNAIPLSYIHQIGRLCCFCFYYREVKVHPHFLDIMHNF